MRPPLGGVRGHSPGLSNSRLTPKGSAIRTCTRSLSFLSYCTARCKLSGSSARETLEWYSPRSIDSCNSRSFRGWFRPRVVSCIVRIFFTVREYTGFIVVSISMIWRFVEKTRPGGGDDRRRAGQVVERRSAEVCYCEKNDGDLSASKPTPEQITQKGYLNSRPSM